MLNVANKDAGIFDRFDELGAHVLSGAKHLHRLAAGLPSGRAERYCLHEQRQEADEVIHRALVCLDATYLPPMDREDIHALAGELAGVIHAIDDASKRFGPYHAESVEPRFLAQTAVLMQTAATVNAAIRLLRESRLLSSLGPLLAEIHRLERLGDDRHQAALSWLFGGVADPLFVLQWKEFYALAENAIDACKAVGNTLERILLKSGS